jgi:hypothetical protein
MILLFLRRALELGQQTAWKAYFHFQQLLFVQLSWPHQHLRDCRMALPESDRFQPAEAKCQIPYLVP